MQEEEFKLALQYAVIAFQALEVHDWEAAARACDRAESLGPILHPTEFIAGSENLKQNKRVVEASRTFVDHMRDILSDDIKAGVL